MEVPQSSQYHACVVFFSSTHTYHIHPQSSEPLFPPLHRIRRHPLLHRSRRHPLRLQIRRLRHIDSNSTTDDRRRKQSHPVPSSKHRSWFCVWFGGGLKQERMIYVDRKLDNYGLKHGFLVSELTNVVI
ncbi:unnamed protein product [Lactuca virosa]|uniref:Uncharacterized protein n=1 Tax=Lactuca virosa TaxID=75947 RepID=A0AAU9LZ03_9ASTR|nr:unnamed protein product [Lactuca virosa]